MNFGLIPARGSGFERELVAAVDLSRRYFGKYECQTLIGTLFYCWTSHILLFWRCTCKTCRVLDLQMLATLGSIGRLGRSTSAASSFVTRHLCAAECPISHWPWSNLCSHSHEELSTSASSWHFLYSRFYALFPWPSAAESCDLHRWRTRSLKSWSRSRKAACLHALSSKPTNDCKAPFVGQH